MKEVTRQRNVQCQRKSGKMTTINGALFILLAFIVTGLKWGYLKLEGKFLKMGEPKILCFRNK